MNDNRDIFDRARVRRNFGAAAERYAGHSALQREIEFRLMESLAHYSLKHGEDARPQRILDVGSGPATAAHALRSWAPKADIFAVDAALPMLKAAEANTRGQWLRRRRVERVCADLRALPFADASVDLLFSNLALQWVEDLPAAFAEFRRVLAPKGLLLISTFGEQTLAELREAFAMADDAPHVSPFTAIAPFGDALMAAGFAEPVLDRDLLFEYQPDLRGVMLSLKAIGATNALHARRHSLSGKARFRRADAAHVRTEDGQLPVRWEAIYAQAWAPEPGTPMRDGFGEIAAMPIDRIPIRRKR
ncbi:methyltransferase domain-containing protein [Lysobacter soyae]|uniref:Malonyl-[acyl-carrier protein] O-methyltransferase n=1 Tax=Lysobacter soyae TaxID=2764185 RepID=A0ABX8WPK7_9GAMM|nr:methyltransferase domain-containing protein [Lysobacter sp. CJ11]QYR53061.1 methyltransferase domain-containing protein [Lysobacter sp. CJ11]